MESYKLQRICWCGHTYNGYYDNPYWRIDYEGNSIGLKDDGEYWNISNVRQLPKDVETNIWRIINECKLNIILTTKNEKIMEEFGDPLEWQREEREERDLHVFTKNENKVLTKIYCILNIMGRLGVRDGRGFQLFKTEYRTIKELGFVEPLFGNAYRLTEKGAKFFNDRKRENALTLEEGNELLKKEIDFNTFPKTTE